ncbi:MAG: hypothetical protein HFG25_05860 [Lachnospiraceae bacterium]|nr:hypothetical protein [Lachnospiraceae bacterium]
MFYASEEILKRISGGFTKYCRRKENEYIRKAFMTTDGGVLWDAQYISGR